MRKLLAVLAVVGLTVAACGGDDAGHGGGHDMGDAPQEDHGMSGDLGALGSAAMADDADRTIEVLTLDSLEFDPESIEIKVGETITFRITNDSSARHDFYLGGEEAQEQHAKDMMGSNAMVHDEPNTVTVEPGETKEVTWTFTETGTTYYGCHEAGHYGAGMKGTITVS